MKRFCQSRLKVKEKSSVNHVNEVGGRIKLVPIFIALDRSGVVLHKVLERNTKENIQAQLKPLLSSGSVLCTDGNISYKGIAEE